MESIGQSQQDRSEYYDDLITTRSYVRLALQFGFGSRESFDNEEYRNAAAVRENRSLIHSKA